MHQVRKWHRERGTLMAGTESVAGSIRGKEGLHGLAELPYAVGVALKRLKKKKKLQQQIELLAESSLGSFSTPV